MPCILSPAVRDLLKRRSPTGPHDGYQAPRLLTRARDDAARHLPRHSMQNTGVRRPPTRPAAHNREGHA
ncbi:hypothetical protein Srubr_81850 [Streptomyces rubradiris]|uniref:Uncharacterized protein n=1 Tax=Streptomyces rubradiris TaxID=285531 RepID=A0ABQ3RAP4_STRRR|nr:hypothetical protein Srubr_27630 [Streptomyces rubradiris]GHI58182.1 hypothetical protein Srubr_80280 [Streptomyces rubradiris]GHI58339.1 hypothetical protein Srubr_81850 [Streptomyces rubradiris]